MEKIEQILEELKFEIGITEPQKNNKDKIILGTGNLNSKILFIGDDGDLYIDEDFKVAHSSSGEFLMKLCDALDLSHTNYYITTLTKSKFKYRELEDRDKAILKDCLFAQISLMNPKLIVALGQDVADLLLDNEINLTAERGKFIDWRGNIQLLITHDVNYSKKSRDADGKRAKVAIEFWEDLKTIKQFISQ